MSSRHTCAVNWVERKQLETKEEELALIMQRFRSHLSSSYWLCIVEQTVEFLLV